MIVVGKQQKGWVVSEQRRHSSCFGTRPAKQWLTHSVAHCIWYRGNNTITDKEMAILQSLWIGGHHCYHGTCECSSRGQEVTGDQGETTKTTSLSSWDVFKGADNQERLQLIGGHLSHHLTCSRERAIKERQLTGGLRHRGTCSRRPCMVPKWYTIVDKIGCNIEERTSTAIETKHLLW